MRAGKLLACIAAAAMLQGCMTTYVPAPEEKMVTVHAVGFGSPRMCKDGKMYWPPQAKGNSDAIQVPAGARVTVGAHMVTDGYNVIHYCSPYLSFVPTEGSTYVMNAALLGQGRCFVELVREDASSRTGLALEPSVGRAACGGR